MWSQSEEFKGLLEKVSSKGTMDELVDMAIKDAPYAYKDVCALLERQMKHSRSASKARLQVLYVISAICRKSKRKFGEKDKYGGRFTPRLETLSGYLAEMPSPYWAAVGKVVQSWRKERVFAEESLGHFNGFALPPPGPSSEQHSLADQLNMAEPEGHLSGFGVANAEASTGSVDKLLPPPLASATATATRLTPPVGTATMSTGSTRQLPLLPGEMSHPIEAGSAESSPTFPGHSGPPPPQEPPQLQPPGPPLGRASAPDSGPERRRRSRWDTSDGSIAAAGSAGIRPLGVNTQEPPPLPTIAHGPPLPAGEAQQPRYAAPPALPPAAPGASQWTAPSSHATQQHDSANVAWPQQPPAFAQALPHWQSPHQHFRPPLPRPPPGGPPIQQQQQQHRPALPAHQQQWQPREEQHSAHPHGPHQWGPVPPSLQAPTVKATERQPQPTQQRAPGPLNAVRSEPGLQQAERVDVKQTAQELIAGVSKASLERIKGPVETWSAQYETLPPPPKRSRWEEATIQPADQVTPTLPNSAAEPMATLQPPPPAPPELKPSVTPEPARIKAAGTAHRLQPDEKHALPPPPPPVPPAASSMPLHATAAPFSNGAANSNAAIAGRQAGSRVAGGTEAMDVADQVARALEIAQKLIGGLERKPAVEHAVQAAGLPQPIGSTKPTSRGQKVADSTLSNITDVEPTRQPPSIGSPAWSEFDLGVL